MSEPEGAKAPGGERGTQCHEESASLYDLRVVVERIDGRPVCGMGVGDWFELTGSSRLRTCPGRFFCADPDERLIMRIERTGQTSVARADVT